ncbi:MULTISPECIES: GntR family transcriptional regulator [Lacticaseibacillus]|uniref:Transcriptional regulator n=1 Tax=Lacticaseibacillus casei DSM 20011 = JCM 1134 = ATCC 393 TaxID=1423732 RepID=A0AAD1ATK9_LACCA|nr:GntR family transcriptional regulator [Lacticaseibacillus casei]MBI6597978.1 GntR family transcriptional regulator [Lacticaseibacillus casei]MBO1481683.1 GntR family transcriptional regulator [Lacticaseibacillus casei]MBO2416963.1 GntR family transcriptional regulator [Lacticaseibacillus casei]MCK2081329.1 GntR family transcriptional regulator [Lacticaseibacillus casei]MDZ5496099.1 GntR family transcriptional regulator [Lacticaseibacillus casei]
MKISIDKSSMIPVYEQIANNLRDMVYGRSLQDGDRLDSEQKMCLNLKVSRGTVRKAIEVLLKEGLVKKVHGKGTFVSNPNVEYSLNDQLMSFAESLDKQHLNYTTQVIKQELLPANQKIADTLKIPVGSEYLYLERLRSVADDKLMLIENRINIKLCPGIEKVNFNNISLFAKIEELAGRQISFARSTYEALNIGTERGEILGLPASTPTLKMQQTVFMSENETVEYGSVWLKGNKYFLTTTLQRR